MISKDDIDAMSDPIDYASDPVFQRMQWEIREAFERGYRSAQLDGDNRMSEANPKKGVWFDHWLKSPCRQFLVDNGMISGDEGYK